MAKLKGFPFQMLVTIEGINGDEFLIDQPLNKIDDGVRVAIYELRDVKRMLVARKLLPEPKRKSERRK